MSEMKNICRNSAEKNGMTILELVVVMAFFLILSGTITVNLAGLQQQSNLNTSLNTLINDIRSQQLKAQTGETQGAAAGDDYGVYFTATGYILFKGSSYNPADPQNFAINLGSNLTFSNISLPQSQVVFLRGSGEVSGFNQNSDSVTLANTLNSENKTVTLNMYGVITGVN